MRVFAVMLVVLCQVAGPLLPAAQAAASDVVAAPGGHCETALGEGHGSKAPSGQAGEFACEECSACVGCAVLLGALPGMAPPINPAKPATTLPHRFVSPLQPPLYRPPISA